MTTCIKFILPGLATVVVGIVIGITIFMLFVA